MLIIVSSHPASAGVTIVNSDGSELPITQSTTTERYNPDAQIESIANLTLPTSENSTNSEQIEKELIEQYGSLENIILASDTFNEERRTVARNMLFAKRHRELLELNQLKHEAKLKEIQTVLEQRNDIYRASNDPKEIIEKRRTDDVIAAAQSVPLYDAQVSIKTSPFDPESDGRITINSTLNNPSAISFYDEMGSMFKIVKTIPAMAGGDGNSGGAPFHIEAVNEYTLIVSAANNHKQVSGFIFLDHVNQPIPITYTSNPTMHNDTRSNYILPMISPESDQTIKSLSIDISKVRNDETDPIMYRFMHVQPVPSAKPLDVIGLPPSTKAWKYKDHVYFRTQHILQYEIQHSVRLGSWYVFKANPRTSYWFSFNNRDVEVAVHEPK
ncbi:hypothetical protein QTV44_002583 [Vibrio vulnificus]|nr:hypothetical protein [Vibrio vulnificus]